MTLEKRGGDAGSSMTPDEEGSVTQEESREQAGEQNGAAVDAEAAAGAAGRPVVNAERDEDDLEPEAEGHGVAATAPVRFGIYAVFYLAGRMADRLISLYRRTFQLDPRLVAEFSKKTALSYLKNGRAAQAIPLLEKVLEEDADDVEARMALAKAYGGAKDYPKAKKHLEKLLALRPEWARVVRALGVLHVKTQEYDEAIRFLEKAAELDASHAPTRYWLGTAYDNKKAYERAVQSFKKAIELNPRYAKAYQALGFTHESMGDRASAVECFKKALEHE